MDYKIIYNIKTKGKWMMKKLQKVFAFMLALSLVMTQMGGIAMAADLEDDADTLLTVVLAETEESTTTWTEEVEVDGTTQTVSHSVLDSNEELVEIGAEPPKLDTENLEAGNMTAQKFGAFEDEEDAENGIVKLTFDVAGKPVEVETPVDLLIIGDESGSMNMYGGADTAGKDTSYMPCLNEEHYYKVDDLQKALYEKEQSKLKNELNGMDKNLVDQISAALNEDAAPSGDASGDGASAPSAVDQILDAKNKAVADAVTASSTADEQANAAKDVLDEAQKAYDAAAEEDKEALAAALDAAKASYNAAAGAAEAAKTAVTDAEAALSAANRTIELLKQQAENKENLASCESGTVYINPHTAGLENIVFKQWNNEVNWDAVIAMVEAAGVNVPAGLTGSEVFNLLFSTKADTPDKNHYYYDSKTGTYQVIDYVTNNSIVKEEGKNYSYWSPEYGNAAGCVDRMMLEKLAAAGLAEEILKNQNSAVGYIGFTYSSYPSLNSGGFMTAEEIDELLEIIQKTEGHDYTNYVHALWTAKNYIENRENDDKPVYVVFISDGVPTRFSTATNNDWNILTPPVPPAEGAEGDDGDCLGYNEIMYGETDYTQITAAMHVADELKAWYKETYGVDMDLYTVGINTNQSANEVLGSMASSEDHFLKCDDPKELAETLVESIDPYHVNPSGVLTDVIGEDFELFVDDEHLFTISGQSYDISAIEAVLNSTDSNAKLGNVVSFQVKLADGATKATIKDVVSVTWEIIEVGENGDQISYYVQLKSEELDKFEPGTSRLYDTNADTETEAGANLVYYELTTNEDGTECFVATEPTTVELWTPHVLIENSGDDTQDSTENKPTQNDLPQNKPTQNDPPQNKPTQNDPPQNDPPEEIPDEDVPLGEIPDVDVPLEEILDEDVPLAEVPKTGDASAMWLILSALSGTGLAGVSVLNHKKRDED